MQLNQNINCFEYVEMAQPDRRRLHNNARDPGSIPIAVSVFLFFCLLYKLAFRQRVYGVTMDDTGETEEASL